VKERVDKGVPVDYDNLADGDLVRAIRSGHRQASRVLVDRHLSDVYAVAMRVCGNAADAEDITQDAFLRGFERLYQYDPQYSFRNWLLKIATNLAISHLRSVRREGIARRQAGAMGWEDSGRDEGLWTAEDCDKWLEQLEASQRVAIVLFHFQEMSYVQVAQVMGVPVNKVRTLIHRGRRRLRELMTRNSVEAERIHEMS